MGLRVLSINGALKDKDKENTNKISIFIFSLLTNLNGKDRWAFNSNRYFCNSLGTSR